jgi:hypothetical protein
VREQLSRRRSPDVHDGRQLPDRVDVRAANGRCLRLHDVPRGAPVHGHDGLRDGTSVLRERGHEHLPNGDGVPRRQPSGLRGALGMRDRSGVLQQPRRRRRFQHLSDRLHVPQRNLLDLRDIRGLRDGVGVL